MKSKCKWKVWVAIGIFGLAVGCGYLPPPDSLREKDLVGVWYADYGQIHWADERCGEIAPGEIWELLVLREDQTYEQMVGDVWGRIYFLIAGPSWWIERLPNRAARLHLKGGRFFPGHLHWLCIYHEAPPENIIGGHSDDGTGNALLIDEREGTILLVWRRPFTGDAYLSHPFIGDPDAPIYIKFIRLKNSAY